MHDRDRILYSSALQRLAYVTQVTAPESGITFHNRLSHSLKVAQVGRRNAERLLVLAAEGTITGEAKRLVCTLDEDAVEAACLAHDLGHPPFGHIAEEVLQERAGRRQVHDRFEGNAQSFRIVTRLAQRASGSGLDLTRQTLEGLLKYPWKHWSTRDLKDDHRRRKWGYYDDDAEVFSWVRFNPPEETAAELPRKSLEAVIMEWADDVTYAVHDVDDFYRAGLVPLERFGEEDSDEMKMLDQLLCEADAESPGSLGDSPQKLMDAARRLFPGYVPLGPYRHTRENRREMKQWASRRITAYLSAFRVENGSGGDVTVRIPRAVEREVNVLMALVRVYVIGRPGLAVVQHGQRRVIRELFDFYFEASKREGGDRRLFPPAWRRQLDQEGDDQERRVRLVIDLIAGLTEDSAIQLHRRLVGGSSAPTLDATAHMA
jgi:dGTPase